MLALLSWLFFGPPAAEARLPAWTQRTVIVRDYTSLSWDGYFAEAIAHINAIIPPRGPRFVYRRMGYSGCPKHTRGIVVCSVPKVLGHGGTELPTYDIDTLALRRMNVTISDSDFTHADAGVRRSAACHTMMHATTHIPDNYDAAPDTSCVWGSLTSPGPFDVEYAQKVYGKDKKKRR